MLSNQLISSISGEIRQMMSSGEMTILRRVRQIVEMTILRRVRQRVIRLFFSYATFLYLLQGPTTGENFSY